MQTVNISRPTRRGRWPILIEEPYAENRKNSKCIIEPGWAMFRENIVPTLYGTTAEELSIFYYAAAGVCVLVGSLYMHEVYGNFFCYALAHKIDFVYVDLIKEKIINTYISNTKTGFLMNDKGTKKFKLFRLNTQITLSSLSTLYDAYMTNSSVSDQINKDIQNFILIKLELLPIICASRQEIKVTYLNFVGG